ncbi:MAG: carboxylating nicotinate-nucleotide diphosphorylase [Candidatus Omnitrophica bacterium]|nr:carboxylating nicotinate-nucleotide diphosphorylase [Candidatus Omnitrophota bacterium]
MRMKNFEPVIREALREDRVWQDVTTRLLVGPSVMARARIIVKEKAVVCGLGIALRVFQMLDKDVQCAALCSDGKEVAKGTSILSLKGKARALLSGERTALNFLGYLSGVATNAHSYVQAVRPYKVRILDTRKTTPGLRELEKYAVRCGGAFNHRQSLTDMVLVKDNHRWICRRRMSVGAMIGHLRRSTRQKIAFEVDDLQEFKEALAAGPDIILLDNMNGRQLGQAVALRNRMRVGKRPLLEASGGITFKNVRRIARTGVDRVSVGALTHSRRSVDVSMEFMD